MNKEGLRELKERFVKDYKFPIAVISDDHCFDYLIRLFEPLHGSFTCWKNLCEIVEKRFDNNAQKFLEYYATVREAMIQSVLNCDGFKRFNDGKNKLSEYNVTIPNGLFSKSSYIQDNLGKKFLSVDMSKANFYALRKYDPSIVQGKETYEDWVRLFTDFPYFWQSKHLRQVVFGQCNPSRQIKVMKRMMMDLVEKIRSEAKEEIGEEVMPTYLQNDEVVYDVTDFGHVSELVDLAEYLVSVTGLKAKVNVFELGGNYFSTKEGIGLVTFQKNFLYPNGLKPEHKCVPLVYAAQVYKYVNLDDRGKFFVSENGFSFNDYDLMFTFEKRVAKFVHPLQVTALNSKKKLSLEEKA